MMDNLIKNIAISVIMGAPDTWIVPHIAEDLIGVVPPPSINGARWIGRGYRTFVTILERMTKGLVERDDDIVAALLEDIWTKGIAEPTDLFDFVRAAASHAYPPLLSYLEADCGGEVHGSIFTDVRFYEQHWLFYEKLRDIVYDLCGDYVDILPGIYATAILGRFDAFYKKCEKHMGYPEFEAAARYYKYDKERLRPLILRTLRMDDSVDVGPLIETCEFDDAIIDAIENGMFEPHEIYAMALGQGREDFAKRIEPYLK